MKNEKIDFIINTAKFYAIISKTFDSSLGGIGFNDFIVLYNLAGAPEKKLRRIDLASKVGLSASGVTRLLLPMEKIGLIYKESNVSDARVSLVGIAPGGEEKLKEAIERMNLILEEKIDMIPLSDIGNTSKILQNIGSNFLWK